MTPLEAREMALEILRRAEAGRMAVAEAEAKRWEERECLKSVNGG